MVLRRRGGHYIALRRDPQTAPGEALLKVGHELAGRPRLAGADDEPDQAFLRTDDAGREAAALGHAGIRPAVTGIDGAGP
jgi:hypothetical protein